MHKLSLRHIYQIAEREQVFQDAQDALLNVPGHAEYYGKEIREFRDRVHGEPLNAGLRSKYLNYRMYAFQTLEHLPSVETVRVLADFLDDTEWVPWSKTDPASPPVPLASKSAATLRKLITGVPKSSSSFADWHQWRDEIRAGQSTFRFKGSEVRYNFAGPVAERGERERKEGVGESGEERSRAEKDDAGAGRDGEGRAVWPILLAGGAFIGALVVWLVRRGR
ncbi:MAG: hypothetical protein HKN82_05680 [Akkermansiaceae bacterium]|nr:hypothetical protein [Akkermansiaceae bacterium]